MNEEDKKEIRARIVDKSKIIKPEGIMEDFKRPNHPDFMTSSELHQAKWSGRRTNSLTGDYEVWMLGNLALVVTQEDVKRNPLAINEGEERLFSLMDVMPDTPDARALRTAQAELDRIIQLEAKNYKEYKPKE